MLLCSGLAQLCHRQTLSIVPRHGIFRTHLRLKISEDYHLHFQINPKLFHSSPVIFLRKPPQSRNKFLGINLSYIIWPSQFLRQIIRKKTHPEMFGVKTEAQRQKAVQTLSLAYALIVWTFLGYVLYYLTNKTPELKEKEKTGMPYEEEVNRGGALWWIANSGRTDIKEEDEIHVWKFKGFSSFEKERITHKAKAVTEAVQAEIGATSDDLVIRRMMGLPLERDGGMSEEELRETMQAMGKDYELELDYARQKVRRRELEERTDAELEALGTFEGKVKLYFRQLRRTLRRKLSREESGIENSDDKEEVLPAEAGREDESADGQVQTPETPTA